MQQRMGNQAKCENRKSVVLTHKHKFNTEWAFKPTVKTEKFGAYAQTRMQQTMGNQATCENGQRFVLTRRH